MFEYPVQNWTKLPHKLIQMLPDINSMAELKVVLYVLAHTWGYQEYSIPKNITIDEFMHGRKRRDGSRIDNGTGLSKQSVVSGCKSAVTDGFLVCETQGDDAARVKKAYGLNMQESNIHTPGVKDLDSDDFSDLFPDKPVEDPQPRATKEELLMYATVGPVADANNRVAEIRKAGWDLTATLEKATSYFMSATGIDVPISTQERGKWRVGVSEQISEFGANNLPDLYVAAWAEYEEDVLLGKLDITHPRALTNKMRALRNRLVIEKPTKEEWLRELAYHNRVKPDTRAPLGYVWSVDDSAVEKEQLTALYAKEVENG